MVELSIYKFEGTVFVAAAGQTVENWKTARAFEWFPVYYYFFLYRIHSVCKIAV